MHKWANLVIGKSLNIIKATKDINLLVRHNVTSLIAIAIILKSIVESVTNLSAADIKEALWRISRQLLSVTSALIEKYWDK